MHPLGGLRRRRGRPGPAGSVGSALPGTGVHGQLVDHPEEPGLDPLVVPRRRSPHEPQRRFDAQGPGGAEQEVFIATALVAELEEVGERLRLEAEDHARHAPAQELRLLSARLRETLGEAHDLERHDPVRILRAEVFFEPTGHVLGGVGHQVARPDARSEGSSGDGAGRGLPRRRHAGPSRGRRIRSGGAAGGIHIEPVASLLVQAEGIVALRFHADVRPGTDPFRSQAERLPAPRRLRGHRAQERSELVTLETGQEGQAGQVVVVEPGGERPQVGRARVAGRLAHDHALAAALDRDGPLLAQEDPERIEDLVRRRCQSRVALGIHREAIEGDGQIHQTARDGRWQARGRPLGSLACVLVGFPVGTRWRHDLPGRGVDAPGSRILTFGLGRRIGKGAVRRRREHVERCPFPLGRAT